MTKCLVIFSLQATAVHRCAMAEPQKIATALYGEQLISKSQRNLCLLYKQETEFSLVRG